MLYEQKLTALMLFNLKKNSMSAEVSIHCAEVCIHYCIIPIDYSILMQEHEGRRDFSSIKT